MPEVDSWECMILGVIPPTKPPSKEKYPCPKGQVPAIATPGCTNQYQASLPKSWDVEPGSCKGTDEATHGGGKPPAPCCMVKAEQGTGYIPPPCPIEMPPIPPLECDPACNVGEALPCDGDVPPIPPQPCGSAEGECGEQETMSNWGCYIHAEGQGPGGFITCEKWNEFHCSGQNLCSNQGGGCSSQGGGNPPCWETCGQPDFKTREKCGEWICGEHYYPPCGKAEKGCFAQECGTTQKKCDERMKQTP